MRKKYTKKELIEDIKFVKKQIGHVPSWTEYNKNRTNVRAIDRHFGSYNKAIVEIFGEKHKYIKMSKIECECNQCGKKFMKHQNQIEKTKHNFCSKSCAAVYNNANKKYGTRRSKLEKYLEEELTKLYPNLEVHYNRVDTIKAELDIYIPSLSLAFELNGIFHYEPIYGKDKLASIQNNDKRKFQACLEKNIELCVIDSSSLKYFKSKNAKKYLDIIINIIDSKK